MYNGISLCEFLEQSEYLFNGFISVGGKRNENTGKIFLEAVSYTHLTLPTILRV